LNSTRIETTATLGEGLGDTIIFDSESATADELLHTIAVLREQVKELKANIYSNKNIISTAKKEKDSIK